jgi:hypothetical protein
MKAEGPHARGSYVSAFLSCSTIPEKSKVWAILRATNFRFRQSTVSARSHTTDGTALSRRVPRIAAGMTNRENTKGRKHEMTVNANSRRKVFGTPSPPPNRDRRRSIGRESLVASRQRFFVFSSFRAFVISPPPQFTATARRSPNDHARKPPFNQQPYDLPQASPTTRDASPGRAHGRRAGWRPDNPLPSPRRCWGRTSADCDRSRETRCSGSAP